MKTFFQRVAFLLAKTRLKTLLLLYYHMAFLVTKYLLENSTLKVWSRNSFYFNIINPGISDIDFTFFSMKRRNPSEYVSKLYTLKRIRCLFPVIGEANIYQRGDICLYKACGNYFELKRDPKLFRQLNRTWDKKRILEDAVTFILRALWSDYNYLRDYPQMRHHKWNFIFSSINDELKLQLKTEAEGIDDVVSNLYLLYPALKEDFSDMPPFFKDKTHKDYAQIYLKIYPHFWLGDNWHREEFENDIFSLGTLGRESKDIVHSQIAWEIWGIYSQMFSLRDFQGLRAHLNNLEKMITALGRENSCLRGDIQTLLSLFPA